MFDAGYCAGKYVSKLTPDFSRLHDANETKKTRQKLSSIVFQKPYDIAHMTIDQPGLDFWLGLGIETYPGRGRRLEPWSMLIVLLSPYVKTEFSYHCHTGTYSDLRCT